MDESEGDASADESQAFLEDDEERDIESERAAARRVAQRKRDEVACCAIALALERPEVSIDHITQAIAKQAIAKENQFAAKENQFAAGGIHAGRRRVKDTPVGAMHGASDTRDGDIPVGAVHGGSDARDASDSASAEAAAARRAAAEGAKLAQATDEATDVEAQRAQATDEAAAVEARRAEEAGRETAMEFVASRIGVRWRCRVQWRRAAAGLRVAQQLGRRWRRQVLERGVVEAARHQVRQVLRRRQEEEADARRRQEEAAEAEARPTLTLKPEPSPSPSPGDCSEASAPPKVLSAAPCSEAAVIPTVVVPAAPPCDEESEPRTVSLPAVGRAAVGNNTAGGSLALPRWAVDNTAGSTASSQVAAAFSNTSGSSRVPPLVAVRNSPGGGASPLSGYSPGRGPSPLSGYGSPSSQYMSSRRRHSTTSLPPCADPMRLLVTWPMCFMGTSGGRTADGRPVASPPAHQAIPLGSPGTRGSPGGMLCGSAMTHSASLPVLGTKKSSVGLYTACSFLVPDYWAPTDTDYSLGGAASAARDAERLSWCVPPRLPLRT